MEQENHIKKRKLEMETKGEIFVLPFFGQGHLFPAMELCKNISSHNYNVTLIIPTHLSSSIPSSFSTQSSFIHVAQIPVSTESGSEAQSDPPPRGGGPLEAQNKQMGEGVKLFMSSREHHNDVKCVVIDVMMSWSKDIFVDYAIPVVSFSTSGATASAMGYGRWKAKIGDIKPGEIRELFGLPTEMAATFDDLNRGPRGRGSGGGRGGRGSRGGGRGRGRPGPDDKPRWVDEVEGSVALLINTCDDLEHLFIEYITQQIKIPVYGVGPLLPEQFWKSAGSLLHDSEMRSSEHKSNYTEHEVIQWLESKPSGSVIYISFGSEVGPSIEEYKELAKALEESNQGFIWVIQPGSGKSGMPRSFLGPVNTDSEEEEEGYYPEGLDTKVGDRGLIITGWAPQLLILSHPSTGGFLSHCGWNSTVEAIGRGIPILGWPLRGDQYDNAKLVTSHLKIGFTMSSVDGSPGKFKKEDVIAGIEKLMTDEKVKNQVKKLSKEFEGGFPASSVKALGSFVEFISQKAV